MAGFIQRIENGALNPLRIVRCTMHPPGNLIHGLETKSTNPAKRKGGFAQNLNGVASEIFPNLHTFVDADAEGSQKTHNLPQGAAVPIGGRDALQLLGGDPFDLQQTFRRLFQNLERIQTECVHQLAGRFRANAFDQSGGKVPKDAGFCGRQNLPVGKHR